MLNVKGIAIAAAAGLLIGASGAWVAQDWRYGVAVETMKREASDAEAQRAKAVADKYRKLQVERDDLAKRIAQIDVDYTGKMDALKNENQRLNDCLRTGKCGLRVAATCKPSGTGTAGMPAPTGTARVDDAGACRLTADAEQDYLALRTAISTQRLQIQALQTYVNECKK